MSKKLNILALFPHPDDAVFYAAGTLAHWAKEGHHVTAVCCTSGNLGTLRPDETKEQVASRRKVEMIAAHNVLGIRQTVSLGFPDYGLTDAAVELRKELFHCVRRYRADRVVTMDPWIPYEVHPDHVTTGRMAAEAATFAVFPLLYPEQITAKVPAQAVADIWLMGPLGQRANHYVDISSTIDKKVAATLKFAGTLPLVAQLFAPNLDPINLSPANLETLVRHADTWVRTNAAKAGKDRGLIAAEGFVVHKCMPGHFQGVL